MRRFLVGKPYRHRNRWYARVEDLKTGRRFRMSSGETKLKNAEAGLRARLGLVRDLEDIMNAPADDKPLTVRIVEDENYEAFLQTLEGITRLAERGKDAITPDDLKERIHEVLSEREQPRPESPLFEDAFEEFLRREKKGVSAKTLQDFHYAKKKFYAPALGGKKVDAIKHRDIKKLLNQFIGTRKARTHNGHRMTLNSFFAYCLRNEYCEKNPVEGIKRRPVQADEREGKPLTVEQCRALLRAARQPVERNRQGTQGTTQGPLLEAEVGATRLALPISAS